MAFCLLLVGAISWIFLLRPSDDRAGYPGAVSGEFPARDFERDFHEAEIIVHLTEPITPADPAEPVTAFFPMFPLEYALVAIPADPWDMLQFPVDRWRDSRFEVFSWDRFPEILVFDISTFGMQDRLFKRLAFFVEKAGFRGRLSHDEEIADLHGWNAHNYQASDLAVFFNLARSTGFPLLDEEWELESILLRNGVLALDPAGNLVAGRGAVLSLTQERSHFGLRPRFMAHEVFHGLFFIDADFREFSRQRWEAFPEFGRTFFLAFLRLQEYDIEYEFLVINEFMGHLLQLPVAQNSWFFGQHISNRLFREGLAHALPERYEMREGIRFWPDLASLFTAETEVFSRYVYERWGLAAGRAWRLR